MTHTTPLVLLPGLMCDAAIWRAQIEMFSSRYTLQVPSYGTLASLPAMALHVLAVAPEHFALAGHSMGGRVALEVMRLAPQRVTRLALLDTGCRAIAEGAPGERERRERARLLDLARREGLRAMALSWINTLLPPARLGDAALVDSIVQMVERKSVDIFARQVNALLNRSDESSLLPGIRCPVLVLSGCSDPLSRPEANVEMAAAISGAHLAILQECGHMAPQEQPGEVNRCLSEWLERG
jgi:pimeloyl-ACP methyl ester carboxylesterase